MPKEWIKLQKNKFEVIVMKFQTKKTIMAAMLAALVCVATMIIKIPSPMQQGYLNLGDCVVLLCGFMLSPVYGFLAAGIGSFLADIFAGYAVYAPATFLIKGLMALTAHFGFRLLQKKCGTSVSKVLSGACGVIVMVSGYYVFEGFLYGFVPSLVNIPANALQGAVGLILGIALTHIFEKHHIL